MSKAYKYLIEVAMPVREVSAESVRDKSIRHGHISTLHLWWARRPLPVCRAVVFASLVPDPDDPDCPALFQQAVDTLLGPDKTQPGSPDRYKPYDNIPYTSIVDPVPDTRRNRLLAFIGQFSDTFAANEKAGKATPSGKQISEHSLIKWDNKNNEKIIGIARRLIWVAHNSSEGNTRSPAGTEINTLLADYERHYMAIKTAERALYQTPDRHLQSPDIETKETALKTAIEAFLNRMPRVFDPFAGGGAIPLEAARLGCRTFGNDINPVAHIIQRGSLEFPQRYGKPITYSKAAFEELYGPEAYADRVATGQTLDGTAVELPNRLSHDVAFYAKRLLREAEATVGQYYPTVNGRKPIAYYWARVGTCANPSCRAEVPLLKQFYLCNIPGKQVYLKPLIDDKKIDFEVKVGKYNGVGWLQNRVNLTCPCCHNITSPKQIKDQFFNQSTKTRLLAVIEEGEISGKVYRLPTKEEHDVIERLPVVERPSELMPQNDLQNVKIPFWGYKSWGEMFSNRQLLTLQTLVQQLARLKQEWGGNGSTLSLTDYHKALLTYLGIWIDRIAVVNTSFGRWHSGRETLEHPFSRQAIPMMFDFPESNPFCLSTGSAQNNTNSNFL
jgi:putative DNA methylase